MSRRQRRPGRGAALVVGMLLIAATGCGPGAPTTGSGAATAPSSPTAGPAFDGTVVEVQVVDGEVRTARPRVVVPLGGRVRMVVTSDVADELHVHGVDESVLLEAGETTSHEFIADVPGVLEVELHDSGVLLFTLQVQP